MKFDPADTERGERRADVNRRHEEEAESEVKHAADMAALQAVRKALGRPTLKSVVDVLDDSDGTGHVYLDVTIAGKPYRLHLEAIES